ncbi:MAG: DUF502 domain-containing protein [Candidatus Oleimicrobiaceae bacterium]
MRDLLRKVGDRFVAGLLVTVPVVATILAFKVLFSAIDGLVGPLPERLFGRDIPGFGVLVTALVVMAVGLLTANLAGRRIIAWLERVFQGIPLVSSIYTAAKEITQAVSHPNKLLFKEVVMVEYPRKGVFAYGFITSETNYWNGEEMVHLYNVFIPSVPVPTTGWLAAFPANQLIHLNISVERALKLIVSGGIVAPSELTAKPAIQVVDSPRLDVAGKPQPEPEAIHS